MNKIYACIDLKSFYASCECKERGLDPITTNLVVADKERTEKTICLAVSPSLKSYGIGGRARLYEVFEKVKEINEHRKKNINNKKFIGKSYKNDQIKLNPNLELDFLIAKPRMSLYMQYSAKIYNIYLKFLSSEDIYVYSIDEVFCDITNYLKYSKLTPQEFVTKLILAVYNETGITATGGIGTNLYLAKVAMDVMAKHVKPNSEGVRIAYLDELSYRKELWNHRPLTDFWRVGRGYAKKLEENNLFTMGDIAREAILNEDKLFQMFGINAELLIDHAWGIELCNLFDIKSYKPDSNSLSTNQVLHEPYDYTKTKIVVSEMIDSLTLELVRKEFVTDTIILTIGYDVENLKNDYKGEIKKDYYGRNIPKESHGTIKVDHLTSSTKIIMEKTIELFDRIINPKLLVRRIGIAFANLINENESYNTKVIEQVNLFTNILERENRKKEERIDEQNEKSMSKAVIEIKKKYGKNAILRLMNLQKGATAIDRNKQIGGHHE